MDTSDMFEYENQATIEFDKCKELSELFDIDMIEEDELISQVKKTKGLIDHLSNIGYKVTLIDKFKKFFTELTELDYETLRPIETDI